jgi:hypothetical protein
VRKRHCGTRLALPIGNSERNRGPRGEYCEGPCLMCSSSSTAPAAKCRPVPSVLDQLWGGQMWYKPNASTWEHQMMFRPNASTREHQMMVRPNASIQEHQMWYNPNASTWEHQMMSVNPCRRRRARVGIQGLNVSRDLWDWRVLTGLRLLQVDNHLVTVGCHILTATMTIS